MENHLNADVVAIQSITAVPTILEAVAALTGLRFICVARVTANSWTTCAVLDQLDFGLKPGDGLDVSTTLCDEVRDTRQAIIIDHVSRDTKYCNHHTPKMYGFESYISIPIMRPNGEYFGTLCGLDPLPATLSTKATITSMTLFAQLISLQLASENELREANTALLNERETAELREQFIAVLGHDLRNPLGAILNGTQLLSMMPGIDKKATAVVQRIHRSAQRISGLVDDVVDFTRGRMGGGIGLHMQHEQDIASLLEQVAAELLEVYQDRSIALEIDANLALVCDRGRIGQLMSNLLKNALVHGDPLQPVRVMARSNAGIFQLTIINGGVAIPEHTLKQLFKPFWRAAPRSGQEGLGLGLFIVSEIARSHGGNIRVTSTNELTSFTFTMKNADFIERRKIVLPPGSVQERRQEAYINT